MSTFRERLLALAREPLVHFALAGGGLFFLHSAVARPSREQIVITAAFVDALRAEQKERTGQAQGRDEIRGQVDRFVTEELLYREALALGLDQGDVIVRRRLVQKMELLAQGRVPEPSEVDLSSYLAEHADRYRLPDLVSFRHVLVSRDRHGDTAPQKAQELLSLLREGADPATLGDPFVLGSTFSGRSKQALQSTFGGTFAEGVLAAPKSVWSGPVASAYGLHLILVTARESGGAPALGQVRARVREDFLAERRKAAIDEEVKRLRGKYTITLEGDGL